MRRRVSLSLLVVLGLVSTLPAYAYVDPAAGSLLLQLLLGGASGLFFFARAFRRKILRFIGIGKEDKDKSS